MLFPLSLLGQPKVGVSRGRLPQGIISGLSGGDPGGPAAPHHFQCGGGHSGVPLDLAGGRRRRRSGQVVEGRYSLHCLFYAEDGLVASTNPVWLQGTFDTLMRLFDRVGF